MQATLTRPTARRVAAPSSVLSERASQPASAAEDLSVDSDLLLRGQKSVSIVHNGATYRLQATKLGKLILTK